MFLIAAYWPVIAGAAVGAMVSKDRRVVGAVAGGAAGLIVRGVLKSTYDKRMEEGRNKSPLP